MYSRVVVEGVECSLRTRPSEKSERGTERKRGLGDRLGWIFTEWNVRNI